MNLELLDRLFGKRFSGLLVCVLALSIGFEFGDPAAFPSFATTIGLIYAAFVGGQSYTDGKEASPKAP